MIFDLLTSPEGHQFDPRVKVLLAFYSTHHPCQFDMPQDHVRQKKIDPPSPRHPRRPQVNALRHDPGVGIKTLFDMFHIFYL